MEFLKEIAADETDSGCRVGILCVEENTLKDPQ